MQVQGPWLDSPRQSNVSALEQNHLLYFHYDGQEPLECKTIYWKREGMFIIQRPSLHPRSV